MEDDNLCDEGLKVEQMLMQALVDLERLGKIKDAYPGGLFLAPRPGLSRSRFRCLSGLVFNRVPPDEDGSFRYLPVLDDWATQGVLEGLYQEMTGDRFAGASFLHSIAAWVVRAKTRENVESYVSKGDALAWAIIHEARELRDRVPSARDEATPAEIDPTDIVDDDLLNGQPLLGVGNSAQFADSVVGCGHFKVSNPTFDLEAARGLSADEVRARWPRVCEVCPDCDATVVRYASEAHYFCGDW